MNIRREKEKNYKISIYFSNGELAFAGLVDSERRQISTFPQSKMGSFAKLLQSVINGEYRIELDGNQTIDTGSVKNIRERLSLFKKVYPGKFKFSQTELSSCVKRRRRVEIRKSKSKRDRRQRKRMARLVFI